MKARGRARFAAQMCCASLIALACQSPAPAQSTGSAELDPTAPLDPLPDLGVEWPDMKGNPVQLPPDLETPAPPTTTQAPPAMPMTADEERRYSVSIEGLSEVDDEPALVKAFDAQSALHQGGGKAANAAQIDRRSHDDSELLAELLRSHGYYDADVEPRIDIAGQALTVVLVAQPGHQYVFQSVDLPGLEGAGEEAETLRKAFAVKPGDAVDAQTVIDAGTALKVALGQRGFALAEVGEQQIELDHRTYRASLVLPVTPGPIARFGQITVSGMPPFSARHVATIARFKRGDRFQESKVTDLRRALIATGLIASADVKLVPAADRRTVDVAVHLEPAPRHTIAGELGYGTGEGVRVEASWQDRNFFNPEGALTLRGVAGTKEQLAGVEFRRSNFRRRDQTLDLQALASKSDLAAYQARTVRVGGFIERQSNIIWHKKWTYSLGADLILTDERGVFADPNTLETRTFFIAALPSMLRYDGTDDLLDPTEGFRLGASVTPEISGHGQRLNYVRGQIDASAYKPLGRTVLAGRIRLGTIFGAEATQIAPSRRFYSGGGGSVRGYGYQELGPRDGMNDPMGGRGLAEFSLEARIKIKLFDEDFGVVPFLDGGTLSRKEYPDFSKWQLGAGIGIRYYSTFGPIRVDVGTPLNPQNGDAPVAVVVSLGQAF